MVPNGWKLGLISDLADTVMGYAFKSADFAKAGIPLLRMGNLYQNTLSFDRNPIYLPESFKNEYERFLIKPNDLVMSMTGTMGKRDYGFTVKIPTDAPYSLLNQRVLKFVPKHESSSGFLLNLLRSEIILSRLYAIPGGTKQANLSAKQIQELPAPIPPLPEQRKIAKILSTWDKAISTTESLIDNSKQQKKALMQQLLTGAHTQRKRLLDDSGKPFEGEWQEVKLGQITEFIKDGTHGTHKRYETGVPMLSAANITKNHKICFEGAPFISEVDYQKIHAKYEISAGDILLTVVGTIGRVAIVEKKERFTLQRSVAIIRASDGVDNRFLMQLFSSNDFNHLLVRKSNSTAQAGVYLGELAKIKILLPAIEEQQKIASVLVNADKEIELLEQQLADLKQEKKALMQQLLTGKRRVKVDEKEVA